jgi:hypothetical protein
MQGKEEIAVIDLIEQIPSTVETNYIFKNFGNAQFKKMNGSWGFEEKNLSNGAAYADLDNDGDLDIIVNNIDAPAAIYRNNNNPPKTAYLKVDLLDTLSQNREGIGSTVTIYSNGKLFQQVQQPTRGYQSSVSRKLHFGLGKIEKIDSIEILWPDGQVQLEKSAIQTDFLRIYKKPNKQSLVNRTLPTPYLKKSSFEVNLPVEHKENDFVDFKRERLLPHFLSTQGPRLTIGDVNQDGLSDFYLCGAKGSVGSLLQQQADGSFIKITIKQFEFNSQKEEVAALFFDADGDGDDDLYVVSGGNENEGADLQDQLYINERGDMIASEGLPKQWKSGSCVTAVDYDLDGDLDLFVGSRGIPGRYPQSTSSQFLINEGQGNFKLNNEILPNDNNLGNVTDALWEDVNDDQKPDLVLVGEWMPLTVLYQKEGKFTPSENQTLKTSSGLWNRIAKGDFNQDGKMDFVVGNYGLNSQLKAPLSLYYDDYDNNGALDPILCTEEVGEEFPFWSKDDIQSQLVQLKSKYVSYASYANQTIGDVLNSEQLKNSNKLKATILQSSLLINEGNDDFTITSLPPLAQVSPIFSLLPYDINADGKLDLILGGNLYGTRVKLGRYDGSKGEVFIGDGGGSFDLMPYSESGLRVEGEVRDIGLLTVENKLKLVFAKNNGPLEIYEVSK